MAQEIPETTYVPEVAKDARKERERRTVQDGTALWKRRKEELERRKHREQHELQQILENYSPWGKPGGGAPCAATLRKKNVPLEPIEAIESLVRPESLEQGRCRNFGQGWTSDATIERIHRKHINPMGVTDTNRFFDDKGTMSGVASGMPPVEEPMRRYNDEVQVYELTGGVELVPLLTSRRYYSQQPQSTRYVATDATRPGYTIEPRNDGWNKRAVAGTSTPGGGSGVGRVMAPPWIMPIVTIYTTFSTVRSSIEFPSRTCHGACLPRCSARGPEAKPLLPPGRALPLPTIAANLPYRVLPRDRVDTRKGADSKKLFPKRNSNPRGFLYELCYSYIIVI